MELVAAQHVESSWTRDQTCVPCIGRRILIVPPGKSELQLLSGSSACQPTLKILDLPSLHNDISQFLKVYLSPSVYTLFALFLWRTLTHSFSLKKKKKKTWNCLVSKLTWLLLYKVSTTMLSPADHSCSQHKEVFETLGLFALWNKDFIYLIIAFPTFV